MNNDNCYVNGESMEVTSFEQIMRLSENVIVTIIFKYRCAQVCGMKLPKSLFNQTKLCGSHTDNHQVVVLTERVMGQMTYTFLWFHDLWVIVSTNPEDLIIFDRSERL